MQLTMYAYFNELWLRDGADAAVRFAKECGFDSIEILDQIFPGSSSVFPDENSVIELRNALDRHGLRCACYSVGICLLSDDLGKTRNLTAVDALKKCADRAHILSSPYLHHTLLPWRVSDEPPALALDHLLPTLIERATEVAKYSNTLGITTLYEPQGYYINGPAFARFYEPMKASGCAVGVCGDVGNCLYANASPAAFFERYAKEIRHVHLKDLRIEDARINRQNAPQHAWDETADGSYLTEVSLGSGAVALDTCMQELYRAEYEGAFALETFYWDKKTTSLASHLGRDRDYMMKKYANR